MNLLIQRFDPAPGGFLNGPCRTDERRGIFPDDDGKMNHSLIAIKGKLLLVSQFTFLGGTHLGRRPGFDQAAPPDQARKLFDSAIAKFREKGVSIETGQFGVNMLVSLKNNGPVTFILNSLKGGSGKID